MNIDFMGKYPVTYHLLHHNDINNSYEVISIVSSAMALYQEIRFQADRGYSHLDEMVVEAHYAVIDTSHSYTAEEYMFEYEIFHNLANEEGRIE